jgi:diacylglycerol O-acyltransferase / wax synthase
MSRMSDAEAIMWAVEKDPALRSDFINITILDRTPDEQRLRASIDRVLEAMPRLTQRVVSPPLRVAPPEWLDDPHFDFDYHVRTVAAPAPGGERELLDLAAALSATPLDRSRPLWEFTLVKGLEGGRAALLQKVHHTITDGVGGVRLSLSLLDFEPNPEPPPSLSPVQQIAEDFETEQRTAVDDDPVDRTTPFDILGDALTYSLGHQVTRARRGLGSAAQMALHPSTAAQGATSAARLLASIRRQLFVTEPARSPLMRARSLGRSFDAFQASLEDARRVASTLGGSVNDAFVTGITGALGLYHERMGEPCDELRMAMPISTRSSGDDSESNSFTPARVVVPVQPKDPTTRFELVHERLASVRSEPAIAAAGSLAGLLTPLPTSALVALTRSQAGTIDFAASNLRGSPVDLYLGGARIEANFPMGPRTGCAVNVTLLSYKDSLDMGLNIDPAAVTDSATLLDCFDESFGALFDVAR